MIVWLFLSEAKKRKQELPDMKEEMTASAGLAQTQKQKTRESHENDKEEQEIAVEKTGDWRKQWKSIKLPKFGVSPGPSPTPSPPCSPVPVAVSNEQGSSEVIDARLFWGNRNKSISDWVVLPSFPVLFFF